MVITEGKLTFGENTDVYVVSPAIFWWLESAFKKSDSSHWSRLWSFKFETRDTGKLSGKSAQ